MFSVINIVLLANSMQERGRGYMPAPDILCISQIRAEADIQLRKIVLHAHGPICSRASFWSFLFGHGFLITARKALRQSSSWKVLKTWPNKYNWFKCVMSSDKKNLLGIALLVQISVHFKSSTFFSKKWSKVLTEKYTTKQQQQQQYFLLLIFKNFYCQI